MAELEKIYTTLGRNAGKRILYQGILISFVAYLVSMLFFIFNSFETYKPIILAYSIFLLFHGLAALLLNRLSLLLVKELFTTASILFIVLNSFFLTGTETGVHYYFLVFALLALSYTNPGYAWIAVIYFITIMLLFAGAEFGFISDSPVVELPERLAKTVRIQSIMLSFMMVIIFSYLFYKTNLKKEQVITKQNEDLLANNAKIEESRQHISLQNDKLQELNNELQKKLTLISRQNEQLEEAHKTKEKFYSIIAHDLKNPLNALVGLSELLSQNFNSYEPEEVHNLIQSMHESAIGLNKLLLSLLYWSQTQINTIQPQKSLFKLCEVIDTNEKLFAQNIKEKQIVFEKKCEPGIQVFCDKAMIDTVIRNLLANAIKFTQNKGSVSLSAETVEGKTVLKVRDTGIGIATEKLSRLFSLEKTILSDGTNRESGLGLGLIITKDFLRLNDCKLSVQSEPDAGSVFTITFPPVA
ncbi:MAG: hypothetical protein CSA96_00140 [Bacteroidetes bacterium]|nr:MAG: hypothetical protein CSA96_00140 [Bacteroidota bacterium]